MTEGEAFALITNAVLKRFWSKVEKHPDGCWVWTASKSAFGHGVFRIGPRSRNRLVKAHRFAWAVTYEAPSQAIHVCHHCDMPSCVRPDHLFVGSQLDNVRDMVRKGRRWLGDRRGERNHQRKLTDESVLQIRNRVASGESRRALAREFGVAHSTTKRVVNRTAWGHVA